MTKWNIPEGRKPLSDADIAALTRRLAGTAVDYKELYEAAKRDAEEAEAYAAELESKLHQAVWALEPFATLAKHHAADAPEWGPFDSVSAQVSIMYLRDAASALEELKGEKYE
jgi:hypothetical protein